MEYNLATLEQDNQNIEALNRLARAYAELNQIKQAKKLYKQVLELDRYNAIAKKNLDKLDLTNRQFIPHLATDPHLFLEEPGKTKSVHLIKTSEAKLLNHLAAGETVLLTPKTRTIAVHTAQNQHLGYLPDDLSHRLIKLMRLGNKFTAIVRGSGKNSLNILIRETFRSKRSSAPSFSLPQSNTFSQ